MLGRKGRKNPTTSTSKPAVPITSITPAKQSVGTSRKRKTMGKGAQPPRPWRILIAGDDADSVELLARLMDAAGHEVVVGDSQMEVLGQVAAGGVTCVLLDMTRSGTGDANNMIVSLRTSVHQLHVDVPIVLCGSRSVNAIFAWDSGADEVLRRPFRPEVLEEAIESAVVRPASERAGYRRSMRNLAMDGQ